MMGLALSIPEGKEYDPIKAAADVAQLMEHHRKRLDRAIELYDLEQEGRLVVLPCKVGDTVYKLCPVSAFLKKGDMWDGRIIKRDCDMCAWGSCDCHDVGPYYDGNHKNVIHEMTLGSLSAIVRIMPYWGKFYFMTREEAEAALRGEENG